MIKLTEIINITQNLYYHKGANPTADNVILKKDDNSYKVLLIKRTGETEFGKWALPGGFVDTDAKRGESWQPGKETPKQAAIRELIEETGLDVNEISKLIQPVGVYEGGGRDPRDNKISWSRANAFVLLLPEDFDTSTMRAGDDAGQVGWFDVNNLPKLAFDHNKIINDAIKKINMIKESNDDAYISYGIPKAGIGSYKKEIDLDLLDNELKKMGYKGRFSNEDFSNKDEDYVIIRPNREIRLYSNRIREYRVFSLLNKFGMKLWSKE